MTVVLNPYISFQGRAREALEFYASVFGGEPVITTFAVGGQGDFTEEEGELVMHGQLTTSLGLTLMCSDSPASMPYTKGDDIQVSLSGQGDEAVLEQYWNGLIEGGTETVPFVVAPWGDRFGMLVDKFGVSWLINSMAAAA